MGDKVKRSVIIKAFKDNFCDMNCAECRFGYGDEDEPECELEEMISDEEAKELDREIEKLQAELRESIKRISRKEGQLYSIDALELLFLVKKARYGVDLKVLKYYIQGLMVGELKPRIQYFEEDLDRKLKEETNVSTLHQHILIADDNWLKNAKVSNKIVNSTEEIRKKYKKAVNCGKIPCNDCPFFIGEKNGAVVYGGAMDSCGLLNTLEEGKADVIW